MQLAHPDELDQLAIKVPPHSREAEQSVLGALLLDNQAFDRVSWLTAESFYSDANRRLWACLASMLDRGRIADLTTVGEALGDDLEKVGGFAYLGALMQESPGSANIVRYAELVQDKALRRKLIQKSMEVAEQAFATGGDAAEIAHEAEASFLSVLDASAGAEEIVPIGRAATEYLEWLDAHPNGIETGLKDFDAMTGGLLPGNLVIVAGRTHMGKTSLALQFAEHICTAAPGVMFSLEGSRREVAGRLIEWHKHRLGRDGAVDKVFNLKLSIDETSVISPSKVRSRLRRFKRQHGLSLVVVDYLQLMEGKGDSREQEVSYLSRQLKSIAKDFQVPVIALAQLNRKVEERADKRPYMSDLRESGAIEQDADLICLLYRPDYYDADFQGSMAEAEIMVPKNRNNGRTGTCKVMFSRDLGRFGEWLPERFRTGAA